MRILASLAVSGFFAGALAAFGADTLDGKTKLFGNSFGILARNATYDYVVVGGGTAGLAIASRLAENPNITVAVIEAGSFYEMDNGNTSQVPGYGVKYLSFNDLKPSPSLVDWGLITEPQEGLNGRRIHYNAGKSLGGSSALNDMIFHRPTKGSYQQWADLLGDDTFLWENFLPYLEKSVNFTAPRNPPGGFLPYDPSVFSPIGGPLHASFPIYRAPIDDYMERAFRKSGLRKIHGLMSGHLNGFAPSTLAVRPSDATRSSSEASFLQQALDSTSLTLYLRTLAKKVLFNESKIATGVLVETNGADYTISASKEVIVSSGVFHSPHILMLSGIGPKASLEEFDIPVLADLPGVGQNLIDHLFMFTSHELNITTNSGILVEPSLHTAAVEEYINHQSGPLTGVSGDIVGWEKLPNRSSLSKSTRKALATFPDDFPEMEYLGLTTNSNPEEEPLANNYISVTTALQTVFSRGWVKLASADPHARPRIHINALSHPADAELAVGALKRIRQFGEATGVRIRESAPGLEVGTDEQILEWVRNHAVNGYHAGSTCAMGKESDPNAVLDSRAKVFGVTGLRVVDASSFPLLPAGHPMSTIYALAELIAEDILNSLEAPEG